MEDLTSKEIYSYLENQEAFKQTSKIRKLVKNNINQYFQLICQTISEILQNDKAAPISKLLALKLSKDLIDIQCQEFIDCFEQIALQSIKIYAEFDVKNYNGNRGANFFGKNADYQQQKIGVTLISLASECAIAWAKFFPITNYVEESQYFTLYAELHEKGLQITKYHHYNTDYISQQQSPKFEKLFQTQILKMNPKDQMRIEITQNYQQLLLKLRAKCQIQQKFNPNNFRDIKESIKRFINDSRVQEFLSQNDNEIKNIINFYNLILAEITSLESNLQEDVNILKTYCLIQEKDIHPQAKEQMNELILNIKNKRKQIDQMQQEKIVDFQDLFQLSKKKNKFEQPSFCIQQLQQTKVQSCQNKCPIPNYIHFKPIENINTPKFHSQDDQSGIQVSTGEIFIKDKIRKGNVVGNLEFDLNLSGFTYDNLSYFKQRCLGFEGILYEDYFLQLNFKSLIQNHENRRFYTYGLYITNIQKNMIKINVQFSEVESFNTFWAEPKQLLIQLEDYQTEMFQIAIETKKIFSSLKVQIEIINEYQIQVQLPIHINQQIIYNEFKVDDFQNQWKCLKKQNLIRTDIFTINKKYYMDYNSILVAIPKLKIINEDKILDYELEIAELKIGGFCQMKEIKFLIKIELVSQDKLCIYLAYKNKYCQFNDILKTILSGYHFIFKHYYDNPINKY